MEGTIHVKYIPYLLSAFLINQVTSSTSQALNQKSETYNTDSIMLSLGKTLQNLYPIVFSEKKYKEPQSQQQIRTDVEELIKAFKLSEKHFNQQTITYKISYEVMLDHLKDTQNMLNNKNVLKANEMLKAIPVMCSTCHAQDGHEKKNFLGLDRTKFDSDYSYADFCFSTRDYKNAARYYDKFLTQAGTYHSEQRTEQALIRLMTIHIQMNKDLNMAASSLNEYVKFIKESPNIKNKLQNWVKNIQNIQPKIKENYTTLKSLDYTKLEQFAQTYLLASNTSNENEKLPYYVIFRGMIYQFLNSGKKIPQEEMPFLLYWLAKCDKTTNLNDYTTHADVYLKECYIKYPDSNWAKACKKEYDSYATLALLKY